MEITKLVAKNMFFHVDKVRKKLLLSFLVLSIGWGAGCHSRTASQSAELFPVTQEAAGWARVGETRTFPGENLFEYIDGAADKFTQAGLERAQTTDYRYQEKVDAAADVSIMKTPEAARKVFESEASPASQPLTLGDRARISKGSLLFIRGRFYVKLVAFEEAPEVAEGLKKLGEAIERKLPAS